MKEEFFNPSLGEFQTLQTFSLDNNQASNLQYDFKTNLASVTLKAPGNANQKLKLLSPS